MKYLKTILTVLIILALFSFKTMAEDELLIYTALQEKEAETYVSAFEKESGIKVKLIRKSTGVILNILRRQKDFRPDVDIVFGGPAELYYLAAKEGLFHSYLSPFKSQIPFEYMDSQDRWWGIYIGSVGFAVNKKYFAENDLEYPKTWADLTKADYQGLITVPNPVSSGTGYTILSTILQIFPKKEAQRLLKNINKNVKKYTDTGAMATKLTAIGYSAIGISFSHDIQKLQNEAYQLKLIIPAEGTGYEIGGMAVIKDSKNIKKAEKFIDFMLSKKGQNLYTKTGGYRLATNFLAKKTESSLKLSSSNLIDYNLKKSAENKKENLEFWQTKIYFGGKTND